MSAMQQPVSYEENDQCDLQLKNSTFQVLSVLVPSDSPAWRERRESWFVVFYLMLTVFGILFLGFAMACLFLLIKRHIVQRFKVRTFIAIDLALIILGISRTLFIILDPWGQTGFCSHLACVIVSRLLGSLAFPSLTASYTLVFITLWISARIRLGRSWIQKPKVLVPLCFLHYGVAIVFEIIAALPFKQPVVVVIMLIACEVIFSLWGFLVCLLFGIAGFRLLRTVKKTAKSSSMICRDSPNLNRHDLIEKSKFHNRGVSARTKSNMKLRRIVRGQQKKSVRKVTLITYITVLLGMLYSLLSLVNIVFMVLVVFDGCLGTIKGRRQDPEFWLTMRCIFFVLEISMGVLLTYAISDYTPLVKFVKKIVNCSREDHDMPSPTRDESSLSEQSVATSVYRGSLPRNLTGFSNNSNQVSYSQSVSVHFSPKSPSPLVASTVANGNGYTTG